MMTSQVTVNTRFQLKNVRTLKRRR